QLVSAVEVESVDLAFWETFPNASLRFKKILIRETFAEKDTLFYADKLFLKSNLLDLISHNYILREIEAMDAVGFLRVNEEGKDNWHIFKKSGEKDSVQFDIRLKKIELTDSHIVYENGRDQVFIDLTAEETKAKGNFSDEKFDLDIHLEGIIHSLISNDSEYGSQRKVVLSAALNANIKTGNYSINNAELEVENLLFEISGDISSAKRTEVNLRVNGKNLHLSELLRQMPENIRNPLKSYEASGDVSLGLTINGEISKKKQPSIHLVVDLSDGRFRHSESGTEIKDIVSKIRFSDKGKNQLEISSLTGTFEKGNIALNGIIDNLLTEPRIDLSMKGEIGLTDLKNFLDWDTLETCSGNLSMNSSVTGRIKKDVQTNALDWRLLNIGGTAVITDGKFRLKESTREFSSVNATLLFNNLEASAQQLTGEVNGSDFQINGTAFNLLPFLLSKDEHLRAEANLHSRSLDITNLIETTTGEINSSYEFSLPGRMELRVSTTIEKCRFKKFEAQNVSGILFYENEKLRIDPVSFNTADGNFLAQIVIVPTSEESFLLACSASLAGINIQKLFYEFDNFGQSFITDKHLKGKATANATVEAPLTKAFKIQTEKLKSLVDISIESGQLTGLEALQDIAGYIRKNKFVAPFVNEEKFADKLKDIRFSTLENTIEISNRTITIPQMNIRSTAMDIVIRGKHTFDNAIDYTLGFSLRDILIQKKNDWNESDDGLGKKMFLYMKGTTEHPEFGVDKTMGKEQRQQEMEVEKQNVKSLLKQELGLFKGDNTIGKYVEKEEPRGSTTTIQWEEFDQKPTENTTSPEKKTIEEKRPAAGEKNNTKKLPRWLQEKEEKEEKEP
ncbi:MAG: hypothetical protein IT223_10150, partial [Crocinitomicaceae bacterium]|nr:hypothetical protein [Crocinitomicaceae bacterium]